MELIFDKSVKNRRGVRVGESHVPATVNIDPKFLREKPAELPELSELDVVRHFTKMSRKNFGLDTNFYPLGSCTMKYNPKMTESVASLAGFAQLHPLMPQLRMGGSLAQGALRVLYETDLLLREIAGMAAFTLQPLAGSHGELTGMMIVAAYHRDKGNTHKNKILIPDSAHGTNPASAAIAGFEVETVPSNDEGIMDFDAFKSMVGDETAGVMLTCPSVRRASRQVVAK